MFGRSAARLDGRRSRVPGRRDDERDPLGPATQLGVEHPPEQLEGDVLERERRAVEELEQPHVLIELDERAHGLVVERRVRARHIAASSSRSMPSTNGHTTSAATLA